ncbi:kunitz-type protease inhibitor 1a [Neoarius graeffei]|uniref:kunitz-type protease inhibitor 1a n=1 Tax=Neoarius graeffei TaxID=443677 RepID=UPI00298CB4CA|nr:kunitz-type protease inhibitor 1a [Neoarius graeffei]XP_060789969.1 kunitz-type protease inhibitor 1a [Neoarius graeffei]
MKMMMVTPYQICVLVLTTSLLPTLLAQDPSEQCLSKFTKGREDFVLDTEESVKDGAGFLASPQVSGIKECVSACCAEPDCNLALMESGAQEGTIKSCFLFNCLYKQKKVCHFVRKDGFSNYLLASVFDRYLEEYVSEEKKDQPPKAKAGQDRVVQPNDDVRLSGFESKDDNKIIQYEWVQVSGSPTAVLEKTTYKDEVKVSKLSAGVYKFRLTVTDSIGQTDSAEVTVLVLTPEQSQNHCLVPKKVGPCRGSFPRWYYNALTEKCLPFTFGGCSPNRNNYLSEEECKQACDQVSVQTDSSLGRLGPIESAGEQCGISCGPEKFTCANGCCIDEALECDQVQQCSDGSDETQCANLGKKLNRLLNIDTASAPSRCTQPPLTGPCRESNTMWYYSAYERKCIRFNYGGCQGNDNQFNSEDACMNLCSEVTERDVFINGEVSDRLTDDDQSVPIAIAVALGLAILILLVVLGYCFLKGKKQRQSRHQHISANGAHLLPVEDTEKFVYNSTTKPI